LGCEEDEVKGWFEEVSTEGMDGKYIKCCENIRNILDTTKCVGPGLYVRGQELIDTIEIVRGAVVP